MNKVLGYKGVRVLPLTCKNGWALIYIYRPKKLKADFKSREAKELLFSHGYPCKSPERCIVNLVKRLEEYGDEKKAQRNGQKARKVGKGRQHPDTLLKSERRIQKSACSLQALFIAINCEMKDKTCHRIAKNIIQSVFLHPKNTDNLIFSRLFDIFAFTRPPGRSAPLPLPDRCRCRCKESDHSRCRSSPPQPWAAAFPYPLPDRYKPSLPCR